MTCELGNSLLTWNQHFLLGNHQIRFETSDFKMTFPNHKLCFQFNFNVSKFTLIFPNQYWCFQVYDGLSKFMMAFPSLWWPFQVDLCFQLNNRVFEWFLSYVSKLIEISLEERVTCPVNKTVIFADNVQWLIANESRYEW